MSITFNDDEDKDIDAFLPAAQAIIKLHDDYPEAMSILNRIWFEGYATSREYSVLRKAIERGLRPTLWQRIRRWVA